MYTDVELQPRGQSMKAVVTHIDTARHFFVHNVQTHEQVGITVSCHLILLIDVSASFCSFEAKIPDDNWVQIFPPLFPRLPLPFSS